MAGIFAARGCGSGRSSQFGLLAGPGEARAADQTTQYRVDPQHSNAVPDSQLQPPLKLRWQANLWRRARRAATVTLRFPRGALGRGDHWLVCTRERKPDAFGRPRPLDPLCGQPTLAR